MIKISILLADLRIPDPDTGMVLDVIVFTGVAFFKDIIDGFASVTAKGFFIVDHRIIATVFTAMITAYF